MFAIILTKLCELHSLLDMPSISEHPVLHPLPIHIFLHLMCCNQTTAAVICFESLSKVVYPEKTSEGAIVKDGKALCN